METIIEHILATTFVWAENNNHEIEPHKSFSEHPRHMSLIRDFPKIKKCESSSARPCVGNVITEDSKTPSVWYSPADILFRRRNYGERSTVYGPTIIINIV